MRAPLARLHRSEFKMDASLRPLYYRCMADPRSAGLFASLRAAAHVSAERFLVGMGNARDRARVAEALGAEGTVLAPESVEEALDRLAEESFEMAVFDVDPVEGKRNPATAARELRPFTDLIFVADG